MTEAYFK